MGSSASSRGDSVFRAVAEAAQDGIILVDRHGIIEYVNASVARIFGYEARALVGRNISLLIPPAYREAHDRHLADYRMTGRSNVIGTIRDVEGQRQDGSKVPLEISLCEVSVDGEGTFASIVRDISARKKAESDIQELFEKTQQGLRRLEGLRKIAFAAASRLEPKALAQTLLDELLDTLPYAAATLRLIDENSGKVVPFACKHIDFETWKSKSRCGFADEIIESKTSVSILNIQKDARTESPEFFRHYGLVSFLGVPLILKERPIGILSVFNAAEREFDKDEVNFLETLAGHLAVSIHNANLFDQIKRQKAALERAKAQLQREIAARHQMEAVARDTEKLAATGRIAARVAHEINNPLAGIQSSFQLLKMAVADNHPYYAFIGRIEKEINRIAAITRQMFDLYRPDEMNVHTFRPRASIENVSSLLMNLARQRGVAMKVDDRGCEQPVTMSEASLSQILYNLALNAIDASPPGGVVCFSLRVTKERLTIQVRDQGPGIPPEIRSKVFEPFFTTKTGANGRGIGLGLSVSRNLAHSIGGTLDFTTQAGAGTVFTVSLPSKPGRKE